MDPHFFGSRKHFEHEPVLQQRFAAADGQAAAHRVETATIFPNLLDRPGERDGNPIGHLPGVGVVAIDTLKLAAAEPGDDADTRPIYCRAGCKGVDKSAFTALERRANVYFADL